MENLVTFLKGFKNHSFASVEIMTCQKSNFNKKSNPFDTERVFKVSKMTANINFIYEKSVNNALEKIGLEKDFVAQLGWQKLCSESRCIVTNESQTEFYLYVKPVKWLENKYYYLNDNSKLILMTESELKILNEFRREKKAQIIEVFAPNLKNVMSFKISNKIDYKNDELHAKL